MKRLPFDVSSFSIMQENNYLYIDKTQNIYDLITKGRLYFLSRPRRFGKTLLISTFKEIFLGNKKLFEGLWIDSSDYTWEKHPVLHFDFSRMLGSTVDEFKLNLAWKLQNIGEQYGVDVSQAPTIQTKLESLVSQLSQLNKVVILIDEYDYPILASLRCKETARRMRDVLKNLFASIKSVDESIKFLFITGVTKISKTSLFSGMNNLNDISLKPQAATLLGYTHSEIDTWLKDYVKICAEHMSKSADQVFLEMASWYNGYCFSKGSAKVYNPFSVLYYLEDKEQQNYWAHSGTPSFLIHLLKEQYQDLLNVGQLELSDISLGTFEIERMPLMSLLFQAGYLTISGYNEKTKEYRLSYPNREVEESFKKFLLTFFTSSDAVTSNMRLRQFKEALLKNDIEEFCSLLEIMLAGIPYNLHIERESYYHSLFQVLAYLLDCDVHSEVATSKGRIDLVITTHDHIFIFEFKFQGTAVHALEQIDTQKYAQKYGLENKKITLVGLSFNFKDKQLHFDWVAKPFT